MAINRDLCAHIGVGGDADSDPHGHSALEIGPSAGRGSEQGQARWHHGYVRDPYWPSLGTVCPKNASSRRGFSGQ